MSRTFVLTDPRFPGPAGERLTTLERWALRIIRDERDLPFVYLCLQITFIQIPIAAALFWPGVFHWWMAPLYWAMLFGVFLDRYILMLHNTSHRKLYQKPYAWLGFYIPWVLGPFNGQTPGTYFAHHIGMHHAEENLLDDLSSTMPFQRDKFSHFLRYFGRFLLLGPAELPLYHLRKGRKHYVRMTIVGELAFYLWVVLLGLFAGWGPALTVFAIPIVIARFLMMAGNWAQHAFIDAADPMNPYLNSIVTVNCRYNRRCYNDGYHIGHHESAGRHWTDMPGDFEAKRARYVAYDAMVFEGLDYFMIWLLLMTKRYDALASRVVELGAEPRPRAEVLALMHRRLVPVSLPMAAAAPVVSAPAAHGDSALPTG
jgi:hypothetical protein